MTYLNTAIPDPATVKDAMRATYRELMLLRRQMKVSMRCLELAREEKPRGPKPEKFDEDMPPRIGKDKVFAITKEQTGKDQINFNRKPDGTVQVEVRPGYVSGFSFELSADLWACVVTEMANASGASDYHKFWEYHQKGRTFP